MLDVEAQKVLAARWAADQVEDGMVVGLGSGTTATHAVQRLGERVRQGLRITGVATSAATETLGRSLGITVLSLDDCPQLDLAIDGADEVDRNLDLIKGLGGALLREKLVELAARELTIVVDQGKPVLRLGERAALPVEIVPFGWRRTQAAIEALGCQAALRAGPAGAFVSDSGHYVLDCRFGPIRDAPALAAQLKAMSGVVDHGLFLGMATRVVVGQANDAVTVRTRDESSAG